MFKKIITIAGNIFLGINAGMISPFMPIYLILALVLFPEEPLNANILAVFGVITAIITFLGVYIYSYKKKREHEGLSLWGMTLSLSFAVGALLIAVIMFIYAAGEEFRI
ncbi:MAG: hypothetical protein E7365_03070 [Clostridiales bacterium]|nr:hypothetical protein [Clostridiales bacterium]